ncbi:MAG: PAS domain S-box protein [Tenuifilaceae bacterium]|nr:PAS domain S-box protein [Tenuifilaceae bacterium]
MENENNRKEALRKRIEDVLRSKKFELGELSSKTLDEVIQEVSIYHQELEYQNQELQRVTDELDRSKLHYHELFQEAPMGYVIVDETNVVTSVNNAFAGYFNSQPDEIKGRLITNYIHADFQDQFYLLIKKVQKERLKSSVLVRLNSKTEKFAKLECKIQQGKGKTFYYMGFLDVTREVINEEQLIESRERYRAVADYAYHWEYWQDPQGHLLYMSPSCERITGYSKYDFFDNPRLIEDIVHPEDRTHFDEHKSVAIIPGETRVEHTAEYRITRKDGKVIWIGHACQNIYREDGTHIGLRVTNRDITERKKTRDELHQKIKLLSQTQEIAKLGSWEFDLETNRLDWSNEIYRIFGVIPQQFEVSYDQFLEIVHPDDREAVNAAYVNSLRDDANVYEIEHRIVRRDNHEVRYVYEKCYHERDNNGRVFRSVGMIQDITERKQREQKLVISDRIFNHALDMLCIAGFDGFFKILNPAWSKVLGYTTEELMAKPWLEYVHPSDKEATKNIKACIVDGQEVYQFENRYICKDGTVKWLSWNSFPYPKENIMFGVARDVTFRKQAEEKLHSSELQLKEQVEEYTALNEELNQANDELRSVMEDLNESNQRTKAILSALPDLMFVLNREGVYIDYYSPNDSLLVAKPSAFLGKSAYHILPKDIAEMNKRALELLFETGEYQSFSYSLEENDETKYFDARLVLFGSDRALAIVRDITEQKKGQLTIAKNEKYLKTILQTTADGFWITDLQGNLLEANGAYCKMSGYSLQELKSLKIEQIDVNENPQQIKEHIGKLVELGSDVFDTKHRRKDGTIFDVEVSVTYLNADGGQLICFTRDITERKHAQEKLRESEERFKLSMEATNDGLWDWNVQTSEAYYSPAYYTLLGYEVGGFPTSSSTWKKLVHPEDWAMVNEENLNCVNGLSDSIEMEFRMKSNSGEWKWIYSRGRVVERDKKGIALRIVGTHVDITERKQFEDTLKQRNLFIQTILDNLPIGVALNSIEEGSATYMNKKFQEIYGWSEEELRDISQFFHKVYPDKHYREELMGRIMADIQSGDPERMRWENIKITQENGSTRIVNAVNIPLFEQNTMVSTVMDVTEQRRVEDKLAHSHNLMRYIIEHSRSAIAVHDRDMNYIFVSQRYLKEYNVKDSNIIGKNHYEIFPDLPQKWRDVHQKALAGEISSAEDDPYYKDDGTVEWTRWECRPWFEDNGSVGGVVVYTEVITERKRVEEALKHSYNLMQYIIHHDPIAIAVFDRDMNYVYVSQRHIDDFKIKQKDLIGKNHYQIFPYLPQKFREVHQRALAGEYLKCEDEKFFWDNGSFDWGRWECRPWFEADGSIGGIIIYTEFITDRKRAEEEIRKFKTISDKAVHGSVITDLNGNLLYINDYFAQIHGYTKDELVGKTLDFVHNASQIAEVQQHIVELLKNGKIGPVEVWHTHRDGTAFPMLMSGTILNDDSGNPQFMTATAIDLTEMKKVESALRDSELNFKALFEKGPIAVAYHKVIYDDFGNPINYHFIDANEGYQRLTGVNPIGKLVTEAFPGIENDPFNWIDTFGQVAKTGKEIRFQQYLQANDRWYNCVGYQNKPDHFVAAFIEITDAKRAELALKKNEAILSETQKLTKVGGWEWDVEKQTMTWTDEVYRIHGLSREDIRDHGQGTIAKSIECYAPEYRSMVQESFGRCVEQGEPYDLEVPFTNLQGEHLWIRTTAKATYANGKIASVIGNIMDITERKHTEIAVRQSEEKYRMLFEANRDGIAIFRVLPDESPTYFIEANPSAAKMLGYTYDEFLKLSTTDLEVDVDMGMVEKRVIELKTKGMAEFETKLRHKRGHFIYANVKGIAINYLGEPAVLNITRDITERKQAELALKAKTAELEAIYNNSPLMMCILDEHQNVVYANNYLVEFFGKPYSQIINGRACGVFGCIHATENKKGCGYGSNCPSCDLNNAIAQTLKTGESLRDVEYNAVVNVLGENQDISLMAYTSLIRTQKKLVSLIFVDVSDRKKMENALRESEELFRMLAELAPVGIIITDEYQSPVFLSPTFTSIFGYTSIDIPTVESWFLLAYPDEEYRNQVKREWFEFTEVVKKEGVASKPLEYPVRCKDGSIKQIEFRLAVSGTINVIIFTDITERKLAEVALRESEERFRGLYENATVGIYRTTPDGQILMANPALLKMIGYDSFEELSQRDLSQEGYEPEYPREEFQRQIEEKGEVRGMESAWRIKNGSLIYVSESARAFRNERGKIVYYEGIVEDITSRKKAVDALRASEERISSIFRVAPIGIGVVVNRVIIEVNQTICDITGYAKDELLGQSAQILYPSKEEYEYVGKEKYRQIAERGTGTVETIWQRKDGSLINVLLSSTPIVQDDLKKGVTFTALDITQRKQTERLMKGRLKLLEFADTHSLPELLKETLAVAEDLTGSQIGFYSFIDEANGQIMFNYWSQRTEMEFCKVTEKADTHYPIEKAGVWVECIKKRKPIIHNDYQSLPNRKDFPSGHATLFRELTVPVFRNKSIVAVLAIGNKATDYTKNDIDIITQLADMAWDIAERKMAEEALKASEGKFRLLFENMTQGFALHEIIYDDKGKTIDYRYLDVNPAFERLTGLKVESLIGRTVLEIMPNTEKYWIDSYGQVAETGEPIRYENYSQELGRYYDVSAFSPKKGLFAVVFSDVTERKLAEDKIIKLTKGIEQSPATVVITDIDGNIEFVNPMFTEVTGYTAQEAMGQNPRVLKSDYHNQEFYKELWDTIKGGNDWRGELCNKKKNGELYWESASISPIKNEMGEIVNFIAVKEDITDRKNAILALEQNNRLINTMLDNLPVGIFMVDALNGKPIIANEHAKKLLGKGIVEEASTETLSHVYRAFKLGTNKLYPTDELPIVRGMNGKASYIDDMEVLQPDGNRILVEVYGCPVYNSKGDIWASLIGFTDITERKKAEDALRENEQVLKEKNEEYLALNEELTESNQRIIAINHDLIAAREKAEESDKLKSAFLANMSHEIRTPMNAIIGFSEMLLNPNLPNERKDFFAQILNTACHQLLNVVEDVIDISKIETGQMDVHLGETPINQTLNRVREIFLPQANANGVKITTSYFFPNGEDNITTDTNKLNQVLTNLVSNAVKFTDNGTIHISYAIKNSMVEFSVADTGVGIDIQHHDLIFERFRQVEMGSTRQYGGTGLGLPISKSFIEMLGGTIWLESEPGKGATFSFTIPYNPTLKEETANHMNDLEFDFTGKTILIAEDEEANFLYINELIEETGATIIRATNGQEAIDIFFSDAEVNIILMDIKMPMVGGIEATEAIRLRDKSIPIIALTAYAMASDREKCLSAGCNRYLSKPVRRNELLRAIAEIIM